MEKLKIAVWTDSFFPGRGGTEIATYNLCKNLILLGHQVVLFCPDYNREQEFNEFPVYRVKSLNLSYNDKMALCKKEYKRILKIAKDFKPDINYYCTASGMARMAIDTAKEMNIPVVGTMHTKFKDAFYDSSHSHLITKILLNSLVKKLKRTDKVICVSHDLGKQLNQCGYKGEIEVIKNGIDYFAKTDNKLKEKDFSTFKLFFCGHLIKVKNIQFTLKCLSYLKKEKNFDNFEFSIVGSGKYANKLKKLVKKLDLNENVVFLGYVGDKEKLAEYNSNAHLFLISSTFDNDPLVVLEASQCGTPTLALKDTGSSERLVDNVNGWTANYNVKDYAERIYEIINNKEMYEKVRSNLSTIFGEPWIEVAKRYEKIFIEEINKKSK